MGNANDGSDAMQKARIGVIGAGWWACENTIPELAKIPEVELTAVCRHGADELAVVKEKFGFLHGFEDHAQMLKQVTLDGVVVSSPHVNHFEHARDALQHGLHVVVEKPMCTTADDARALEELADQEARQLMVPCGWNFTVATREAKRLVADGTIGKVEHMTIQMASALDDLFSGKPMLETERHLYRPPPSTWADPARSGGYAWGQLCHVLSLALHISDLQPRKVGSLLGMSEAQVDCYNAATVQFEGGATAAISGAATMPKDKGFKVEILLFGSEGVLQLDLFNERLEVWRRDGAHVANSMQPGDGQYHCLEPYHKLAAYCLGESPPNDSPAQVGRRCVEIIDALHRSAASGKLEEV